MSKIELAKDPKTSPEMLTELSDDNDMNILCLVAVNPSTPIEVLEKLSKHGFYEVRMCVAENSNVTSKILDAIYEAEKSVCFAGKNVLFAMARNKKTSPKILNELYDDANRMLRYLKKYNPSVKGI